MITTTPTTHTTSAVFHVDLWSFLDAVVAGTSREYLADAQAAQGATGCPAEGSGLVRTPAASARHLKVVR